MKKLSALAGVVAMAMVPAMVGCAAEAVPDTAPATESIAEGLTVLPTTDETRLNVAYRKGNITIFLQSIRGRLAPENYQPKEGPPAYEVDTRFVADNGRTFYIRRGGDDFVDPTWATDLARDEARPVNISNEKLFAMAAEAGALLDAQVPAQLGAEKVALHAPELDAIRSFAESAVSTFKAEHTTLLKHRAEIGETVKEIPYGDTGGSDTGNVWMPSNYYYIAVHGGSIWWTLGIGEHSATRVSRWSGAWYTAVDNCNHGRCPSEMSVKCLLQYYERTNVQGGFELQTCKTGYSAFSDGGGHNCHDDTRLQLANFHHSQWNDGYGLWCNGGGGRTSVPSCYDYWY